MLLYCQPYTVLLISLPERKALFETQKRQLWLELESIQKSIDFLERQVEAIDQELHS